MNSTQQTERNNRTPPLGYLPLSQCAFCRFNQAANRITINTLHLAWSVLMVDVDPFLALAVRRKNRFYHLNALMLRPPHDKGRPVAI
jgi:hypothetical protein